MSLLVLKGYIRALVPQILIVGLIVTLQLLSFFRIIPPPNEIAVYIIKLLSTHGLPLVMLASFIENFAGLGTYFPGSVAILSAMALTAGKPTLAVLTYIAIVIPAALANICSYFIGYATRNKELVYDLRSSKGILIWYGSTYWHPQLAAVSAMASGGEGIPFWRYVKYFLPVSLAWSVFWALLLYNVGKVVSSPSIFAPLFYCYLIGWILWDIRKHYHISDMKKV